jgi:hypothetical protein
MNAWQDFELPRLHDLSFRRILGLRSRAPDSPRLPRPEEPSCPVFKPVFRLAAAFGSAL